MTIGGNIILECTDLTKQFGRLYALRSISLSVETGEFLSIFGRNGAGKTTFLKIASSLVRVYSGDVSLFGQNLKKAGEETRKRIGFISHENLLYKDLTVLDNLNFCGRLYGVRPLGKRVDRIIERFGLEEKRGVTPRALSSGMKKRLSLARVFLYNPDLLLLDEPYTGLDERASEILDEVFTDFIGGGGTILLVTHNIERGFKYADKVAVLDRGSVVYQSNTADIRVEDFRKKYREMISQ